MIDKSHYTLKDAVELLSVKERLIIFSNEELFELQRQVSFEIENLRSSLDSFLIEFTTKNCYWRETGELVQKDYFLIDVLNIKVTRDNFTRNIRQKKYSVELLTGFVDLIKKYTYNQFTNNL
jgi:hypothetical protein